MKLKNQMNRKRMVMVTVTFMRKVIIIKKELKNE